MSTCAIEVQGLVFEYPGRRALDDVTFRVQRGSITALVGPNGAGKTTLLRCLSALADPLAGRILVDGVDVLEFPRECHRRVGYLCDFYGLYDELSVRRCLLHVARAHGSDPQQAQQRATAVASRLGLEDRLDQPAGTLSRGLRQRLAVAQAIIHAPAVLLLDEPAAGLDPEARLSLSALLLGLRDEGITVMVSSHILAELDDYCSEMLILDQGRVVDHRQVAGAADGVVTFRVEVEGEAPDFVATAAAITGVEAVVADGNALRLQVREAGPTRAALLRALVQADIPVCGFGPERERLQEAYLARVRPPLASPPAGDGNGYGG